MRYPQNEGFSIVLEVLSPCIIYVLSFCLELQKQLGLRYFAPPLPVNLTNTDSLGTVLEQASSKPRTTMEQSVENSSQDGEHALLPKDGISKIARLFETKKTK